MYFITAVLILLFFVNKNAALSPSLSDILPTVTIVTSSLHSSLPYCIFSKSYTTFVCKAIKCRAHKKDAN